MTNIPVIPLQISRKRNLLANLFKKIRQLMNDSICGHSNQLNAVIVLKNDLSLHICGGWWKLQIGARIGMVKMTTLIVKEHGKDIPGWDQEKDSPMTLTKIVLQNGDQLHGKSLWSITPK